MGVTLSAMADVVYRTLPLKGYNILYLNPLKHVYVVAIPMKAKRLPILEKIRLNLKSTHSYPSFLGKSDSTLSIAGSSRYPMFGCN